jgi:hypothetical protein
MHRDRAEELLLLIVAACMLSFLLPFSLGRNLVVAVVVAVALVMVLVLRSLAWHIEAVTPFDGVLVLGICMTVIYLVSFYAFQRSVFSFIVIALFACYYVLMAFLLYQHRWLFRERWTAGDLPAPPRESREFRRPSRHGDPSRTSAPAGTPKRSLLSRIINRRPKERDARFRAGNEPIPDLKGPTPSRLHGTTFKRGIEPLEERPPNFGADETPAPQRRHDRSFSRGIVPIVEQPPKFDNLEVYDAPVSRRRR